MPWLLLSLAMMKVTNKILDGIWLKIEIDMRNFKKNTFAMTEFPLETENCISNITYRKTSNISRTWVGDKIVDNSDVVGASPVGAAPTTSSFST